MRKLVCTNPAASPTNPTSFQVEGTKSSKYPMNTNLRLPVNENKMKVLMQNNSKLYNNSGLPETYYRYFEVALGYFITDGLKPDYWKNYDFQTYSQLVGGEEDPSALSSGSKLQG
jgi:hypothetical protein